LIILKLKKIMGHGSSQIFTDKLFQVRLAAEVAVQHRLREEISLLFSRRRRRALLVFESVCICENLCPKILYPEFSLFKAEQLHAKEK